MRQCVGVLEARLDMMERECRDDLWEIQKLISRVETLEREAWAMQHELPVKEEEGSLLGGPIKIELGRTVAFRL